MQQRATKPSNHAGQRLSILPLLPSYPFLSLFSHRSLSTVAAHPIILLGVCFFGSKRLPVQRVNRRDDPPGAWLQRSQFPNNLLFCRRWFQYLVRFLDSFLGNDDLLDVGFSSNSLYFVFASLNFRQGFVAQFTASSAFVHAEWEAEKDYLLI